MGRLDAVRPKGVEKIIFSRAQELPVNSDCEHSRKQSASDPEVNVPAASKSFGIGLAKLTGRCRERRERGRDIMFA